MDAIILAFLDVSDRVQQFVDSGGSVLLAIGGVILLMWLLIAERLLYFRQSFPRQAQAVRDVWEERSERRSWEAQQIRDALISGARVNAQAVIPTIKTLVALCPLLGLLGTVTGMIAVFDVMAFSGMGNPRLMASGVSKATIPTMAGMVGALSGLFAVVWLETTAKRRTALLGDELTMDH